jgi:hypothetical protein
MKHIAPYMVKGDTMIIGVDTKGLEVPDILEVNSTNTEGLELTKKRK